MDSSFGAMVKSIVDLAIQEYIKQNPSKSVETTPTREIFSRRLAAEFFDCEEKTIDNWEKRGVLPSVKIEGRRYFLYQDIMDLLHKKRSSNSEPQNS